MDSFETIFKHCRDTKHLYFDGGFKHLVDSFVLGRLTCKSLFRRHLSNCTNLQILDLTTNSIVTDISFLFQMPGLKELHLEFTKIKPEKATCVLENSGVCNKLEVLNIRQCKQFQQSQILRISESRPFLKTFLIDGTDRLTMDAVLTMINEMLVFEHLAVTPLIPDFENELMWYQLENRFP